MSKFLSALLAAATAAILPGCSSEEPSEPKPDIIAELKAKAAEQEWPGPEVGTKAPIDLALTNASGEKRKIANLAGENGTVLVFFRSADWCGYCKTQLKTLQGIAEDVRDKGYTLTAVSYDTPEIQKEFAEKNGLTYTMLSDKDSKMIDAFGIRDRKGVGSKYEGYPYASIYILDPSGTIKSRDISLDFKVRPTNKQVMDMIASVG